MTYNFVIEKRNANICFNNSFSNYNLVMHVKKKKHENCTWPYPLLTEVPKLLGLHCNMYSQHF